MGAQTDILRRQVTSNPDRPSTYPSACLPACPPTSASFQQFSKRTPSDLDCTLTRCLCYVLTHLGSAIDAIDDYVQAAAKENRASNSDNTTGTQSTLSRLTTGTKSKVTQSTRENNTAGSSPNVRDGIKRSLSLSPKIAQSKGGHGGTLKQSGALFAESQMPSSGDLTVEDDREVIREIEAKVMQTFVHFAVLCQCTLVELLDSNPPGRSLKTLTFTLHGKQFGRSLVDVDVLTAQLFTRDFTKKLVSLDLSRNLLNPESTEAIMKEVSLLYEPTLPNSPIPKFPQPHKAHTKADVVVVMIVIIHYLTSLTLTLLPNFPTGPQVVLKLPALIKLDLSENPLMGKEAMEGMVKYLKSTKLRTLRLKGSLIH